MCYRSKPMLPFISGLVVSVLTFQVSSSRVIEVVLASLSENRLEVHLESLACQVHVLNLQAQPGHQVITPAVSFSVVFSIVPAHKCTMYFMVQWLAV